MAIQKRARPDGAMPKGLEVEDLQIGEGEPARRGNMVDVRYEIRLRRGELISEGLARSQILGSRRAFVGFERAIEGMQVGGIRRVTVPPHLAYNDGRLLICKLELLAIRQYK
jgi:FKBP-type peptidyl-prolyl cis-trans isomerase